MTNDQIDKEIHHLLTGLHALLNADQTGALETAIIYVALLSYSGNEKLVNELHAIRAVLERNFPNAH